jgi:hypothetical protein
MPLTAADFPAEVQVAFFMYSFLSDRWEGMSGTYMGKDWNPLEAIFDIHKVVDREQVLLFMKMYEQSIVAYRQKKADAKAKQKKPRGDKKDFTHNVQG